MLDRMESSNLIMRIFDKDDRRQIRISLTKKARDLKDEYERVSREMNEIYYEGFTKEEIAEFENILRRILSNLEKWGE